jgi:transglutaminase/protease-like cytokinesis protein 3
MKKQKVRRLIFNMTAVCAAFLALAPIKAEAKSSSNSTPVPADAVSGGVIYSNVYGEVLVTRSEDGTYNYSFFDTDLPSVQQLLSALNSGKKINLDKLLTESSTDIRKITTDDNTAIPNDIQNAGAAASGNRGSFSVGSVYGSDLNSNEIAQVQSAVSNFLIQNNVASMSDIQKVRTAHDFLVLNCNPTSRGNKNHADNAWGALIYHEANAKGYARAMKALCDAMGVGTYIISANGNSSVKDYMWNTVLIDGNWYIVDVFCDDSVGGYPTYLLSDNAYMAFGMRWNTGNNIPVCKKNYN